MSKSLPIPAAARSDPRALEMIRAWIAKEGLHITLNVGFWHDRDLNEAECWGILLADAVRHIANAHEEEYGRDRRETVIAIREAFERELAKPTSAVRGGFVGRRGNVQRCAAWERPLPAIWPDGILR